MKGSKTTVVVILLSLWFLDPALSDAAMDAGDAPESVTIDYLTNLYEEVEFDHQMHTDMFSCSSCHHHTTGESEISDSCARCHKGDEVSDDISCSGCHEARQSEASRNADINRGRYHIDKPSLKGALHLQCVGCHQSEDGPTGCLECHDFTAAGKKRFAIKTAS
ncbi:MAG: cytochrome c3 family protein [Deltaproteobacteria bacterium]|nr:cytochrome c3 family protein [Deltaproteobacteria bacterium]